MIFVGEEGMGKTTLLKCFKTKKGKVKCKENISTNGIEIHEGLSFQSKSENNVLFNAWDFGGQEIFYPTHQFFLTKHAVYVIVFNLANYQMERIEYWLWQIRVIAANSNSTPIFLVGTHMDSPKVCQEALAVIKKDLSKKFPNQRFHGMQGVHFVSCKTGQGIPELRECIVDVVKQEGTFSFSHFLSFYVNVFIPHQSYAINRIFTASSSAMDQNGGFSGRQTNR